MIQNTIIGGKKLPELTNPAGAANIQSGYEAFNEHGDKITGTHIESDRAIFGKFSITSLANVINIPVSKLCANVVVFPLHVIVRSSDFSSDTLLTVCACTPFNLDSGTFYFHGSTIRKGYFNPETAETDAGAVELAKTIQASSYLPITFTDDNIKIVREKRFAIGTYGFVAW